MALGFVSTRFANIDITFSFTKHAFHSGFAGFQKSYLFCRKQKCESIYKPFSGIDLMDGDFMRHIGTKTPCF